MVLTHRRFRTTCTSMRRDISPGLPLLQCRMVRRAMHPPSSVVLVHPVNRSRDSRRSVLPMYECTVIPRPSYNEGRPVGTCGPHRCRVLVCDDSVCDKPRHFLDVLHQRPGVHWCFPRSYRICKIPLQSGNFLCFYSYVSLLPMASRWTFGLSHFKLSRSGV